MTLRFKTWLTWNTCIGHKTHHTRRRTAEMRLCSLYKVANQTCLLSGEMRRGDKQNLSIQCDKLRPKYAERN